MSTLPIKELSHLTGIPEEAVEEAVTLYWQFIRETIENLPLKSCASEEDFNKLRVSFNLPYLGKLYSTYDKVLKQIRSYNYLKDKYGY